MVVTIRIDLDLRNADWIKDSGAQDVMNDDPARALARLRALARKDAVSGATQERDESGRFVGDGGSVDAAPSVYDHPISGPGGQSLRNIMMGMTPSLFALYDSDPERFFQEGMKGKEPLFYSREQGERYVEPDVREAVRVDAAIREALAEWDQEIVSQLGSVSWRNQTRDELEKGIVGLTTLSQDIGPTVNIATAVSRGLREHPGDTPGSNSLAWVVNHEMAHAQLFLSSKNEPSQWLKPVTGRQSDADFADSVMKRAASYVERMGYNPKAESEMNTISEYGRRSGFQEKIAEAAAMFMTSGKTPGPETASMLANMGFIKVSNKKEPTK